MNRAQNYSAMLFGCLLCIALLSSGCNPWIFSLQKNTGWPIEGRILSNYDSVDVVAPNAIRISHDSKIAMRCVNLTDGVFTTDVQLRYGTILNLEFRTTPFDDSTKNYDGLILKVGRDEVHATIHGKTTVVPTKQSTDSPFAITVVQQGDWIDVEVACTNVGRFFSKEPSTQWLLANTSAPGSALFVDPTFSPLSYIY